MCNHFWTQINNVSVCAKCGLTRTFDGKIIFDRRLPAVRRRKSHGKKQNKRIS